MITKTDGSGTMESLCYFFYPSKPSKTSFTTLNVVVNYFSMLTASGRPQIRRLNLARFIKD